MITFYIALTLLKAVSGAPAHDVLVFEQYDTPQAACEAEAQVGAQYTPAEALVARVDREPGTVKECCERDYIGDGYRRFCEAKPIEYGCDRDAYVTTLKCVSAPSWTAVPR